MADSKIIRILIADDHEMVRHGLAGFLGAFPDFQLVGQASNGTQAVKLCAEVHPDVVLMDLIMPEMDGITATDMIKEKYPEIQIIALTSAKDETNTNRALQAGAIAYLHKDISIHDLGNAIRAAAAGKPTLSPDAFSVLVKSAASQPTTTNQDFGLTHRELDVLRLLVKERTNAEIGIDLSISLSTVKTHISNIMSKLGVRTRAEAVRMAIQHRLV
jgi:two-component system, NarL family, response regulator LiaR